MPSNVTLGNVTENAVIRVIGLGGGGNNAVNRMIEAGLEGVQFIAANTDAQVLTTSLAETRVQMGDHLTKGLGAGANPEIGEKAAVEDRDRIAEHLRGSDLVFITAGMGGGTGTGSAPIVAEVSREQGALTVAVVTTPFSFEGPNRMRQAEEGLRRLEDKVDALIVVENQRLLSALDRKVKLNDAFRVADRVLYYGVKGISDVINKSGLINVDFADVRALLAGAGLAAGAVNAVAGMSRTAGSLELRMRLMNAKPSISGIPRSTTSASGRRVASASSAAPGVAKVCTSAPADWDRAIGKKPSEATVAVISTGRRRTCVPSRIRR